MQTSEACNHGKSTYPQAVNIIHFWDLNSVPSRIPESALRPDCAAPLALGKSTVGLQKRFVTRPSTSRAPAPSPNRRSGMLAGWFLCAQLQVCSSSAAPASAATACCCSVSLLWQRPAQSAHRPDQARPRGPSGRLPAVVRVRNGRPDLLAGCLRAACRRSAACCWSSVSLPAAGPICSRAVAATRAATSLQCLDGVRG